MSSTVEKVIKAIETARIEGREDEIISVDEDNPSKKSKVPIFWCALKIDGESINGIHCPNEVQCSNFRAEKQQATKKNDSYPLKLKVRKYVDIALPDKYDVNDTESINSDCVKKESQMFKMMEMLDELFEKKIQSMIERRIIRPGKKISITPSGVETTNMRICNIIQTE